MSTYAPERLFASVRNIHVQKENQFPHTKTLCIYTWRTNVSGEFIGM